MKQVNIKLMGMIVLAALVGAFGFSVIRAQENTPEPTPGMTGAVDTTRTITVTGTGSAYGEPDVAYVELGVEIVNASLADAFSQASESMNRVIEAVTALGIERADIQTREINVFQEQIYDPQTGATGERVYRVRNIVRITVRGNDNALLESAINGAVEAGANTIYGLNFGILDIAELEGDARLIAVENARSRAEQLAGALGVTVGAPISIRETFGSAPIPLGLGQVRMEAMGGDMSAPVSQGQLEVSVQVEVIFALGN